MTANGICVSHLALYNQALMINTAQEDFDNSCDSMVEIETNKYYALCQQVNEEMRIPRVPIRQEEKENNIFDEAASKFRDYKLGRSINAEFGNRKVINNTAK